MDKIDLQKAYIVGYAMALGCKEKDETLNNVIHDFENWYGKYYYGGTAFINGGSHDTHSVSLSRWLLSCDSGNNKRDARHLKTSFTQH